MTNELFVAILVPLYIALLWWGAKHLPHERWQIAAAIPIKKTSDGSWLGVNLTFYGLLLSSSLLVSLVFLVILLGALGLSGWEILSFIAPLLALCVPAARLVARWVEHKPATLTVGGAGFAGVMAAPWLVLLIRVLHPEHSPAFQVVPVMAALATCHVIGEGLGRLACLSFGCCYGKPLHQCPVWLQVLFSGRSLVFTGATKKASYESGLDGVPVLPIQVITSAFYGAAGLLGVYFFLSGWYTTCLWVTMTIGWGWRAYSETLRADYRGESRFSAYQIMALVNIAYGFAISFMFPAQSGAAPLLAKGLDMIWDPVVLFVLQAIWLGVLIYTGMSKVTSSTIEFHLVRNQT